MNKNHTQAIDIARACTKSVDEAITEMWEKWRFANEQKKRHAVVIGHSLLCDMRI